MNKTEFIKISDEEFIKKIIKLQYKYVNECKKCKGFYGTDEIDKIKLCDRCLK